MSRLVCMPAEPWVTRIAASVTAVADCGHEVFISTSGVSELLTTPGLGTVCLRCIPMGEALEVNEVPSGIREQFEEEMGFPISQDLLNFTTQMGNFIARMNGNQ